MAKKRRKSMGMKSKVKANVEKQAKQGASYGYLNVPKGISMYSPAKEGREKIDILPYIVQETKHPDADVDLEIAVPNEYWFKRPFFIHRNVGSDNDAVICLQSIGKRCPICEYRKRRAKEGADTEELRTFNKSQRNLYYVVPRGVKNFEEVTHLFDCSQKLFQELLNEEINEEEDYGSFAEIDGGFTLKVRWTEESINKNFTFLQASRIDFYERDVIDEDEISELPDLLNCLNILSEKELEAKFFETDIEDPEDEDDNEDEEDEKEKQPKKRKSSVRTSKKVKNEDEDEEEEEDQDVLTWDDLKDMDGAELSDVIEAKELDIDIEDYEDEDGDDELDEEALRKVIAEELEVEVPKKKPTRSSKASKTKTSTKSALKSKSAGKTTKNKCPHGMEFGVDTDTDDACDNCKVWEACDEEKESNE